MSKVLLIVFANVCFNLANAYIELETPRNAFDTALYENALDEELCTSQLNYIMNSNTSLGGEFLDAGIRIPRGILKGNYVDLGNYHQCIEISANFQPSNIEGKYCMINIPMVQDDLELPTEWPDFPWPELLPNTRDHMKMARNLRQVRMETAKFGNFLAGLNADFTRTSDAIDLADTVFRLAICVPKTCTTKQFIDTLLINTTAVGLDVTEEFCRLKNDKPFVPGDYAAMSVFGIIILITIVSTSYDLYYTKIVEDPKKVGTIGKSFSLYTNTCRLVTFNSPPGALECVDGIRTLAITWIIILHTFSTNVQGNFFNNTEVLSWMTSFSAIWIRAGQISVDTFFLLSGLLIVYTAVGKMTKMSLLKNLHLFYLHRLLRMFPILATGVFLQATLFNHLSDGPEWYMVGEKVERCRTYWWSTLIYLQNYLTNAWCLGPTWYLAVDVQMHILSPIILFWVLGNRRAAWIALSTAMLTMMVVTTTYNYLNKFAPASFVPSRSAEDIFHYTKKYYINTLTRCSPFIVGMLFGYLLHTFKGKEVHIPKWLVGLCWVLAAGISGGVIYSTYPVTQMEWDSPFWDGIINSFSRPAWAACLGWLIFACTHGYGGPVNWFLSLRLWKLPARISFAMYIFHYPLIYIVNATAVSPTHFTVMRYVFRFLGDFSLSFLVSFVVTVMIESPFAIFVNLALRGGPKKPRMEKAENKE